MLVLVRHMYDALWGKNENSFLSLSLPSSSYSRVCAELWQQRLFWICFLIYIIGHFCRFIQYLVHYLQYGEIIHTQRSVTLSLCRRWINWFLISFWQFFWNELTTHILCFTAHGGNIPMGKFKSLRLIMDVNK